MPKEFPLGTKRANIKRLVVLARLTVLLPFGFLGVWLLALVSGTDRLNAVDRMTAIPTLIAVVLSASAFWGLNYFARSAEYSEQSDAIDAPAGAAEPTRSNILLAFAYVPLSVIFVVFGTESISSILPGTEFRVPARVIALASGPTRTICTRQVSLKLESRARAVTVCVSGGLGSPLAPNTIEIGDCVLASVWSTSVGATIERIDHAQKSMCPEKPVNHH